MNTARTSVSTLRSKLHDYIEQADERHLEAIYVLLEGPAQDDTAYRYDAATIKMLHQRRDSHLQGAGNSYTVEESLQIIRNGKR